MEPVILFFKNSAICLDNYLNFSCVYDIHTAVVIINVVNLLCMYYINIYLYKSLFLFVFVALVFATFLIFELNTYIGFLLMIECTAIFFINVLIINFCNYYNFSKKKTDQYLITAIALLSFLVTKNTLHLFNYNIFDLFFLKNAYLFTKNMLGGLNYLLYINSNLYVTVLGIVFVILTLIIVQIMTSGYVAKIKLNIFKIKYIFSKTLVDFGFYEKKKIWDVNYDFLIKKFK